MHDTFLEIRFRSNMRFTEIEICSSVFFSNVPEEIIRQSMQRFAKIAAAKRTAGDENRKKCSENQYENQFTMLGNSSDFKVPVIKKRLWLASRLYVFGQKKGIAQNISDDSEVLLV